MKDLDKAREKLMAIANDAPDDEVTLIASAIHLGQLVMNMIDSIDMAKARLMDMGVDPGDGDFTTSTILKNPEGKLFALTLAPADEEEAEEHRVAMATATDLSAPTTTH